MSIFNQIINNKPLLAAATSWWVAQLLKVPWHYLVTRKWDLKRMFGAGGMPSSHSASTVALAVSLGNTYGYDSPLFAIASLLASIVMYDAAGVRRAAGKQAEVVNEIMIVLRDEYGLSPERLKEVIGHTPIQVIIGALLGLLIGLFF